MKCLQLGCGFKCEFCKCINITLISLFLSQIVSLNCAIRLANETKRLTSVPNNINTIELTRGKDKYSSLNSNSSPNQINDRAPSNRNNISLQNVTDIRRNNFIIKHSNRQLKKHFYNITLPLTNTTKPLNKTAPDQEFLNISESRRVAQISRIDEDPPEEDSEQQQSQLFDQDDSVDGASSNLNEQKIVRELTKILSKGMSGATDQVKLDYLEQWKKRQKERKVAKDSRAKLFEDLLTAAINTHPEKVKKQSSKKRTKQSGSGFKDEQNSKSNDLYSTSPILSSYPNLDPELASDAETVIQHLQGLASVIDGQTPAFSPGAKLEPNSGGDSSSDELSSDSNSSSDSNNDNEPEGGKHGETKTKVASSSNDRPIVKQFKQIKNRISQRRKQLDQIKKIFNVDLSLNKDGLLQGKTSSLSKKNKETASSEASESGDYPGDESSSSKINKKSSKKEKDKMLDLMSYLRENPEILASVMDELTAGNEYNSKSIGDGETLFQSTDDNRLNYPSMSKKLYSTAGHSDIEGNHLDRVAYRMLSRTSELSNHDLGNSLKRHRVRDFADASYNDDQMLNSNARSATPLQFRNRHLSAEALLLESLRERQLMNLARLERVLADKYQASNRSQVYSTLNRSSQISNFSPRTQLLSPPSQLTADQHKHEDADQQQRFISTGTRMMNSNFQQQRQYYSNNTSPYNTGQSDEEVLHHYMVMNPPPQPNSDSVDDSIVNTQQNQLNSKPYQNQRIQQQQQQYPQLNRFRDWRDVSHSEVSPSQRSDKTNLPNNVTRLPFDLTTGSSAIPSDAHSQPPSNSHQLSSFLRQSSTNDAKIDTYTGGAYNSARSYADSVVTKPDLRATNSFQNNQKQPILSKPTNLLSMNRLNAIRSELKPNSEPPESDDGVVGKSNQQGDMASNDDEQLTERTRRTLNSNYGPGDYFSAYKRTGALVESIHDNKDSRHDISIQTTKQKQQDSEDDPSESDNSGSDSSGAMWAR